MHLSWRPSRRSRPGQLGVAALAAAQRAPESLTVIRYRAQPTVVTIGRLASTAILAYLLALLLPVTSRPVLAPLTALLVAQVTLYQTVRSAVRRVVAVVTGVLLAVALAAWVGFTWWSLGLTIVVALAVGYALHLGDTVLEVPISAMLILSVGTTTAAATGRIIETLVGAGAGLLAGLVFARPKLLPAAEAFDDLCGKMAELLAQMAAGLRDGSVIEQAPGWLERARSLSREIRRVDDALRQAEESIRLNPHRAWHSQVRTDLRHRLEALEHSAITVRALARSLDDSIRLAGDQSPMRDEEIRLRLSAAVTELAAAMRAYGRLALEHDRSGRELLESDLNRFLDAAQERQDQLSELLGTDPATQPVGWPLRGELISHLDRLRTELRAGGALSEHPPPRKRTRALHAALQAGWPPSRPLRPRRPPT